MQIKLNIKGIVQGVGFRPFIYRIAKKNNLNGSVQNLGNEVEIIIDGTQENIDKFLLDLTSKNPTLSFIESIHTEKIENRTFNFKEFNIIKSKKAPTIDSIIPPDTAICNSCIDDIFDKNNRRYYYPFTTCTDCGPRYSIINTLPYDRINTSMNDFSLCSLCEIEYNIPSNRRYHAETIACENCGPSIQLIKPKSNEIKSGYDAINDASLAIDCGKIIAIKGDGGFHITCNANSDTPLTNLRASLNRKSQPFAVMVKDIHAASKYAVLNDTEKELLNSKSRPIIVVNKRKDSKLSNLVAPNLHNIGLLLPYSGTHYLLFDKTDTDAFVMTSANFPGHPMIVDEDEAKNDLTFVDYYLIHNRPIINRIDDSVIRLIGNHKAFIRRSRGFVPTKIPLPFKADSAIGVGAESNNTIAIVNETSAYLSQHIGNTKHIDTFKFHNQVVHHIQQLTNITPNTWRCDLHPNFNTTRFALQKENVLKVQHHYAHILSLMIDNFLPIDANIIGIALDGMGYGDDGTLWGGEIIESSYFNYKRHAHLMPQPLAGGDLSSYYPSRMVYGILHKVLEEDELKEINLLFKHGEAEKDILLRQLKNNINIIRTTSTGRVLDAAAALLGIANYRSYEGEPAMKLESFAKNRDEYSNQVELPIKFKNGMLDTTNLLYSLYEKLKEEKYSHSTLAYAFEESLGIGIAELSIKHAKKCNIDIIGLSGGVAYNEHITETIRKTIKEKEFEFLVHKNIPCGDGGISIGQACMLKKSAVGSRQ